MDLLSFERKLDSTIMRKRLDIQEALKRPMKVRGCGGGYKEGDERAGLEGEGYTVYYTLMLFFTQN